MLCTLRREARRLPGVHGAGWSAAKSAAENRQAPWANNRPFSDSLQQVGPSWVNGEVGGIPRAAYLGASGKAWRWASTEGLEEAFMPMKLSEALAGIKEAATGLLQRLVTSPLALLVALPLVISPMANANDLEMSMTSPHSLVGVEQGGGWGVGEGVEGVWQASVRRKRVIKMRKHKWRKRRKAARQSATKNI